MAVFADTSFFVALINDSDRHHEVADRLGRELRQPIVTTQWVLLELSNYFADSRYRASAAQFIGSIAADKTVECIPVDAEMFGAGIGSTATGPISIGL
jgi:predicted nucleic acid-binding protein